MRPYYEWTTLGSAYARPATPQDHPAILEMVMRHEGEDSVEVAQYWLQLQPQTFTIFCHASHEIMGFTCILTLHDLTPEQRVADQAVQLAWDFVMRTSPPRQHEVVTLQRFLATKNPMPDKTLNSMGSLQSTLLWLTTPRLSWSLIAVRNPQYWHDLFTYLYLRRIPEADFIVDDGQYGVFGHDWRVEPVMDWLEAMTRRELARTRESTFLPEQLSPSPMVLSQPDFETATRQALRDFLRPIALAANPLLRSRFVIERTDGTPEALQTLVRAAVESLRSNPKDEKFYLALWHTYIDPAPTQEAVAERLDLPFSTYRYHLTNGIEQVIAYLWRCELGDMNL
jgi:hypothetical protein